MSRFIMVHCV